MTLCFSSSSSAFPHHDPFLSCSMADLQEALSSLPSLPCCSDLDSLSSPCSDLDSPSSPFSPSSCSDLDASSPFSDLFDDQPASEDHLHFDTPSNGDEEDHPSSTSLPPPPEAGNTPPSPDAFEEHEPKLFTLSAPPISLCPGGDGSGEGDAPRDFFSDRAEGHGFGPVRKLLQLCLYRRWWGTFERDCDLRLRRCHGDRATLVTFLPRPLDSKKRGFKAQAWQPSFKEKRGTTVLRRLLEGSRLSLRGYLEAREVEDPGFQELVIREEFLRDGGGFNLFRKRLAMFVVHDASLSHLLAIAQGYQWKP